MNARKGFKTYRLCGASLPELMSESMNARKGFKTCDTVDREMHRKLSESMNARKGFKTLHWPATHAGKPNVRIDECP